MNSNWQPQACPLARDQGYGYKHYHTEACRYVSAAQLAADKAYSAQPPGWRQRIISGLRYLTGKVR